MIDLNDNYVTKSTPRKLNQQNLRKIHLPLPPLEIKQKIVEEIATIEQGGQKVERDCKP